jgi:hypothetical protein
MIQSLSDNGTELTSNAILRAGVLRLPNTGRPTARMSELGQTRSIQGVQRTSAIPPLAPQDDERCADDPGSSLGVNS